MLLKVESKKTKVLLTLLLISVSTFAWNYESQEADTTHSLQIRTGLDLTKKWNNGLKLGFHEDLRFDVYNSETGAAFKTSFSTLTLSYTPIEYVRFDVGYTLKISGPHAAWSEEKKADPNEWMRHRVYASVSGIYHTPYIKLHLRERVLMEARTDSVNLLEKNKYNWQLRSRLGIDFTIPGQPVKPYLWCEVINTLNAPEYQQKKGHQYICTVRPQVGVKWRLSRLSSLDFYYRFTYSYDRDINITKSKGNIELEEETLFQHAIGVTYSIDW